MKILIAYDGSECADAALSDLLRAGLPDTAEVVIVSVADVFLPPPITEPEAEDELIPLYIPPGVRRAHERAAEAVEDARACSAQASSRVREMFPRWDVLVEACADSPAWAVIKRADQWKPDLVVVGAHGHNVLGGRFILGSISQRVLSEARCSVRVARGRVEVRDSPVRIIIGVDGSPDSEAAVCAVAARTWPKGSEAQVVAVLDTVMSVTPDPAQPSVVKWVAVEDESGWDWVRQVFEPSAEKLRAAGLSASVVLKSGNPKRMLVEEAEGWGADSIFVGAKGIRGIDRFLLGSVSAAVAARAHCSVEIVRRPRHVKVSRKRSTRA